MKEVTEKNIALLNLMNISHNTFHFLMGVTQSQASLNFEEKLWHKVKVFWFKNYLKGEQAEHVN